MTSLLGVCVTMLMDFDRNETEELWMIWSESDALLCPYSYGIWTSPDGRTAVQLCENPIFSGAWSYRWAYGMDWDTDSMLAIGKTQETISAIYNSGI